MNRRLILILICLCMGSGHAHAAPPTKSATRDNLPRVRHLIDTHIHLYDTRRDVYQPGHPGRVPWPPRDDKVLHRPHLPTDFRRAVQRAGVTGVVIVEASPRADDNTWVLNQVDNDNLFMGLVGNLDPFDEGFAEAIQHHAKDKRFVGVRVHLMRRGPFAKHPQLAKSLRLLEKRGLTLDVLMNGEGPATVLQVAKLAQQHPDLRIVVNHVLGYNIDGKAPERDWLQAIKTLAQNKNVWVKISGLYQRSRQQPAPHDVSHYQSVLDQLWKHFGADRLVYGSNWPCTKKSGDYVSFVQLVNAYFTGHGQPACEKFFWQNAAEAYRLNVSR